MNPPHLQPDSLLTDFPEFRELMDQLDADQQVDLVESFLVDLDAGLSRIRQHLNTSERLEASRDSHWVRGSLGSMGFRSIEKEFRSFELLLRAGEVERAATAFPPLDETVVALAASLRAFLRRGQGSDRVG